MSSIGENHARHAEGSTELVWSGRAAVLTVLPVLPTSPDDDAYLVRLGRTIQRIRKKLLMVNQGELARRVGVDLNTISRWESGRTSLSAYNLTRLWRGLDCPAEWLMEPTDSMTELDQRIEQLRRGAAEAARADVEAERALRSVGGRSVPRGRSRA
jgi:transcriptional regulator with XRE-family HTH domain